MLMVFVHLLIKAKKFFDWKLVTTEDSVIKSAKQLKEMGLIE